MKLKVWGLRHAVNSNPFYGRGWYHLHAQSGVWYAGDGSVCASLDIEVSATAFQAKGRK